MISADTPVVLITGAGGGIGAAIRLRLEEGGWQVAASDIEPPAHGDVTYSVALDVRKSESWAKVVADLLDRFHRIDALVNVAGVVARGGIEEVTDESWDHVIAVNQTGTFYGMRAVAPSMRQAGRGSIVNISSAAGLVGFADRIAYVSSKFAVTGMTKAAALELGPAGIRVNSVHPGAIATTLSSGSLPGQPIGRFGQPEEIAELVYFLVSDSSSFSTGAEYVADGGLLAGIHR